MELGGYANNLVWVDLTAGKVEYKPVPEDLALKYIGGRGLGVKFVFDNGPKMPTTSWFCRQSAWARLRQTRQFLFRPCRYDICKEKRSPDTS